MIIQAANSLEEHLKNYPLKKILKDEFINSKIVSLEDVTQGQAITCSLGLKNEDVNSSLLVAASDNGIIYDQNKYQKLIEDKNIDAIIFTFRNHVSSKNNPQMYGWVKTDNKNIKDHFNKILYSAKNITDDDIFKILEGSRKGIGNDLMGSIIGVDGATIRYIRKKYLTDEEYTKYHSSSKFLSPWSKGYQNDRGDIFLSSLEEKVCNFLYEKNIKYKSNITLNYKNKNYSPDIYLINNNVFIEIFGMSNVECYKHKMYEKIKYYTENKIKCLFLFQESFYDSLDWEQKEHLIF